MKKAIKISLALALMAGAASCDMDLKPVGTIDPENAVTSLADVENFRRGFYIVLRGQTSGSNVYSQEQQSDLFHATTTFGNRGGVMYNWTFTVGDGSAEGAWSGPYTALSNINYLIQEVAKLDTTEWSDADKAKLDVYLGEAYFLRAYYHLELAMKFSKPYNAENKDSWGIPYVTSYAPTSDNSKYPDRGTLEQTFGKIMEDLAVAEQKVTTAGAEGSQYITADAVTALKARVAIQYNDWATAASAAASLVNSGRYPLISDAAAFKSMWVNDSGKECILQLWGAHPESLPANLDAGYYGEDVTNGLFAPDYIPEQWVIDLYQDTDIRKGQFFRKETITLRGVAYPNIYLFNKFVGNPEFNPNAQDRNRNQKNKIFRIAEMHLILAEAYARSGQEGEARKVLNDFRSKRDKSAPQINTSGEALLKDILAERTREFIGEGFRLNDLRRFQQNVVRKAAQNNDAVYFPDTNTDLEIAYTDHRATWPIPQAEVDANPQLRSQQNEGYN